MRVVDSYFKGSSNVGGIVGTAEYADVDSCYSESSVNGTSKVAGIVGYRYKESCNTLSSNYNAGSVSGTDFVGGIVGHDYNTECNDGVIKDNFNSGSVSGSNQYGGGIVGYAGVPTTFGNNISIGNVSG